MEQFLNNNEILLKEEFLQKDVIIKYENYFLYNTPAKKELKEKINNTVLHINKMLKTNPSYINYLIESNEISKNMLNKWGRTTEEGELFIKTALCNTYNNKKSLGEEVELIYNWVWKNNYPDILIYKEAKGVNISGDHYIDYLHTGNINDYFVLESKCFTYKSNKEWKYIIRSGDKDVKDNSDLYFYNIGGWNHSNGLMSPSSLDYQIINYVEGRGKDDPNNIFNKQGLFWYTRHVEGDFYINFLIARPLCMSIKLNNKFNNKRWPCTGGIDGNAVMCGFKVKGTPYPDNPEDWVKILYNIACNDIKYRKNK